MKIISKIFTILLVVESILLVSVSAGIIKDLFQKITNTNNRTEDVVKQSAPICGSGIFSTPNENAISPEIIFITDRPSRTRLHSHGKRETHSVSQDGTRRKNEGINEVANEFRFHMENVTLQDLEKNGFNREAPVTFLMHGFTSGYPLQAWISAIVEAYTIERETTNSESQSHNGNFNSNNDDHREPNHNGYHSQRSEKRGHNQGYDDQNYKRLKHNLFIINWNYAARGILYPRAVANIPIVASYATRFINDKLLGEAQMDPLRIQLIGHSLGAHLAGFIGKNTRTKLGRIYGLDPAGPCFGTISGPLYPSSKRLAPSDAEEVITVQTNSALLGIDKPLGKYSVFVEGGAVQPGCKGGGVLKSLSTLTWDGGDFDTVACSHSRAPNLLTYRHDQSDSQDDCQLVAYECKDWDSFLDGHCGICRSTSSDSYQERASSDSNENPTRALDCIRIGLDWQYSNKPSAGYNNHQTNEWQRPVSNPGLSSSGSQYDGENSQSYRITTKRTPSGYNDFYQTTPAYNNQQDQYVESTAYNNRRTSTRRPTSTEELLNNRERRAVNNSSDSQLSQRRGETDSVKAKLLFIRTGDTQPYCIYHYQVILELNEPFPKKKPPMSIVLQDSESDHNHGGSSSRRTEQNSLSNDEFGKRFNDKTYTHLLTGVKKLKRIDHATLLFREGLPDGHRILKSLHINYMSHIDPNIRQRLSSHLCPVRTDIDRQNDRDKYAGNRFYFKPCDDNHMTQSSSSSRPYSSYESSNSRPESSYGSSYGSNSEYNSNRKPYRNSTIY